jgi:hypothetical protein
MYMVVSYSGTEDGPRMDSTLAARTLSLLFFLREE